MRQGTVRDSTERRIKVLTGLASGTAVMGIDDTGGWLGFDLSHFIFQEL